MPASYMIWSAREKVAGRAPIFSMREALAFLSLPETLNARAPARLPDGHTAQCQSSACLETEWLSRLGSLPCLLLGRLALSKGHIQAVRESSSSTACSPRLNSGESLQGNAKRRGWLIVG